MAESSPKDPKPLRLASNLSRKETLCERLPVPAAFVSAKPRADVCDLHCGEKFFLPPSLCIPKASRPRGVVLLILMFVFLCFLSDRIVNAITGGGEFKKKKKSFFPFGENNTALLSFLFAEPVSPFSPTTPAAAAASRARTHAITRAIKKWREIKCAKAYGFFSCSKAFFLPLF